jgi:hypothetical protein
VLNPVFGVSAGVVCAASASGFESIVWASISGCEVGRTTSCLPFRAGTDENATKTVSRVDARLGGFLGGFAFRKSFSISDVWDLFSLSLRLRRWIKQNPSRRNKTKTEVQTPRAIHRMGEEEDEEDDSALSLGRNGTSESKDVGNNEDVEKDCDVGVPDARSCESNGPKDIDGKTRTPEREAAPSDRDDDEGGVDDDALVKLGLRDEVLVVFSALRVLVPDRDLELELTLKLDEDFEDRLVVEERNLELPELDDIVVVTTIMKEER